MDFLVLNYLVSLGLTLPLAVLIAFRAGKMWSFQLRESNYQEKLFDLTHKTLKEETTAKLQSLLDQHFKISTESHFQLPGKIAIQSITNHLYLKNPGGISTQMGIYQDLTDLGEKSIYFRQALEFCSGIFGCG